jgi:pimeloyl-ACP methyl ester carboxylesterase
LTDPQPDPTATARETRTNGIALECRGRGEPLLLIHGTGGARFHWDPVAARLAESKRLLLVDLPGHGRSEPLRQGLPRTPEGYAAVLAETLTELGVQTVDICGHSAGAWTALELAKLGRARSVVAIAPAGMWPKRDPWSHLIGLAAQHVLGRAFAPLTPRLLRSRRMRTIVMQRSFARPGQLDPLAAIELAQTLARTRGLLTHLRHTRRTRFRDGRDLSIPVTVAWGDTERLIPTRARLRDELPADARFVTLRECGHMAVWDDPDRVSELVLDAARAPRDVEDRSGHWEDLL